MKEVLKRLGLGFVCGVAGVHLLTIALSTLRTGELYPVTAALTALCGSELLAVWVQFLVSGAWGAAVCAGTLFWTREKGSFLTNSLWNYLLTGSAFLLWAWVCVGCPRRWDMVWFLFTFFTSLYAIGWLIRIISLRDSVAQINALFSNSKAKYKPDPDRKWKAAESVPYFLLVLVVFRILPEAVAPFDAADVPVLTALILPLIVFPFTAVATGFGAGVRCGFNPFFLGMTLLTVARLPPLSFRERLVMQLVYTLLALLGNLAGAAWRRWRHPEK